MDMWILQDLWSQFALISSSLLRAITFQTVMCEGVSKKDWDIELEEPSRWCMG